MLEFGALLRQSLQTIMITVSLVPCSRASNCRAGKPGIFCVLPADWPSLSFAMSFFQADSLSLWEKVGHDSRRVHSLVSRVARYKLGQNDRIEQLRKAPVEILRQ